MFRLQGWSRGQKLQPSKALLEDVEGKKSQLKLLETHEAAQELMFSRQKLYEYRDKPGKYLTHLLAEPEEYNWGEHMCLADGSWMTSLKEKLDVFTQFQESLHNLSQPSQANMDRFLERLEFPKLSEEHSRALDTSIQESEILHIIDQLKGNKSPGLDGHR